MGFNLAFKGLNVATYHMFILYTKPLVTCNYRSSYCNTYEYYHVNSYTFPVQALRAPRG